ncbi:MAG: hypothetical protein AAB326_06505, partial [Pseudomonadota bacterium]
MNKVLIGLTIAAALTITGCATTPSKPRTFDQLGQYTTVPLNDHSYRISFQGNSNMSFGTAEEINLVKAAQTTLLNGFTYFKVLDDPSNRTQQPPRKAVVYPSSNYYPYGWGYRRHPVLLLPQRRGSHVRPVPRHLLLHADVLRASDRPDLAGI